MNNEQNKNSKWSNNRYLGEGMENFLNLSSMRDRMNCPTRADAEALIAQGIADMFKARKAK